MCFDIGSQHLGCWGQNTSRIQNKEVYTTLYLQAPPSPPSPERMTVSDAAAEWDEFFYNKLKDQALSGLFSENGSPNYWYRTWPGKRGVACSGKRGVLLLLHPAGTSTPRHIPVAAPYAPVLPLSQRENPYQG